MFRYNMAMKKNIIITAANATTGDFLITHWLHSIKANINLDTVDILVIDYGLTPHQKTLLDKSDVILFPGLKKYHIVNKRFFDAATFLKTHSYDQVLFVDSGDVIFQGDINAVFKQHIDTFRAVPLGKRVLFFKWFIFNHFEESVKQEIWKVLRNKPVINAGVIFAPAYKFILLCDEMEKLIRDKEEFGPDQIVFNYHLRKNGVKLIDPKYNYMMNTMYAGFRIRKGVFFKLNGEKIVIVHNCGQLNIFRPIHNFGYGEQYNQINHIVYSLKRVTYYFLGLYQRYFK